MKYKLLYVNEERIPAHLRELVLSYIPKKEFEIKEMTYLTSDEEKKQKLAWADVVLFAPGRFLSDEILSYAKNVKLMQLWSSGYDKFNIAGTKKLKIPVANNGGANACSVAEHAILLMLATYRWLPSSHNRVVTGTWAGNSHGMDMFLMNKKKVGIIGFGNIGRQVAKKLKGFEMEVAYYDIVKASAKIEKELGVSYKSFSELIKTSDIITLHLHSNDNTRGIIGAKEIKMMKKNATLINVSRAQLVDNKALYEALRDKKINGAGMDVYDKEPTTANDPLLILPNVVATPHIGGSTYDTYVTVMERVVENLRRACKGEKPNYVINN
jgi:phosphoglycerate dehydrogenase-like enzyme